MKNKLFLIAFLAPFFVKSQCLNIESILVDACSPPSACVTFSAEGQNEMVLFKVGNAALNVSSLTVNWPNNSFKGWSQNATTAANVNALNSTILSCGYLKEPTGGILPANKRVLAITSESMCLAANSFANLDDTLIIIFQTAGNTQGHFVNTNNSAAITSTPTGASSTRTLQFIYTPNACTNSVIYDRSLLTNSLGTYGGSISQNDGAKVEFDSFGNATYTNQSCQAPFIPLNVHASTTSTGVCPGSGAPLTATAQGSYSFISWSGGTGTFSPTNSLSTSYTPSSSESGVVSLTCTLTKTCGSNIITATATVNINVKESPQANVTSISGASLCPGNTATLTSSIINSSLTGPVSYNWLLGNISTSNYTTASAGIYTLSVSNNCGSNTYTTGITGLSNPTINITASSNTLCAGGSVTLTAFASPATYTWNNGSNTASIVVSPSINAVYTASTANTCSQVAASNAISVTPQPTLSLNANLFNICGTQTANIIATAASGTFLWNTGATTSSISTTVGGVYNVTVTNACNTVSESATVNVGAAPAFSINASSPQICPLQTVILSPAGSTGTFTWSTGAITQTISASTAGVYSATLANNCGTAINSITLTAVSMPTLTLSQSSTTVCSGGNVTITATGSNGTYSWNTTSAANTITVSQAGIYSTTLTNACGSSNASVSVIAGPPPIVSIIPASTLACSGQAATLTANSLSGGVTYSWSQGVIAQIINPVSPGIYTAAATNSCGTGTATYNLVFSPLPTVSLSTNAGVLCSDSNAILSAFGTGTGTYNWPQFPANTTGQQPITMPGTYMVNYSNACGAASASVVVLSSTLAPDFSFVPNTSSAPATIAFTNLSQNNFLNSWNLGNGQSALSPNTSGTYTTPGIYSVTLFIENTDGCRSSITKTLEITFTALGQVPEIITPNNDGKNDYFEIKGLENYPLNRLQVFNRWGSPVYSAKPYANNWDGTPNTNLRSGNGKLPAGTYYFLLELGDENNTIFKGFIEVVY